MPILSAPTRTLDRPAVTDWSGLAAMTWTGWDGTEWDLLGENGGVFLTRDGVRGLHMPRVDRYTNVSPALAGSRWRGSRTLEREVFWPLFIYSDSGSQGWVKYDRAFWRTMHPDKPGTWSVTSAFGETRTLQCRFADDGDMEMTSDPSQRGWDVYPISLIAEQPYWAGPAVTQSWVDGGVVPFFGADGTGGPPFNISSGNTLSTATMPNPGDVDAYPVWTITGPSTAVSVGVGDKVVEYNAVISPGNTITIDTRPDRLTVVDQDGIDRLSGLGEASFAPIPAGEAVSLSLAMTGTGSVSAALQPLYFRAF